MGLTMHERHAVTRELTARYRKGSKKERGQILDAVFDLSRAEAEGVILEGFFPTCPPDAEPQRTARVALQELGLPYATDPAVTRHLVAFLRAHAAAGFAAGVAAGFAAGAAAAFAAGAAGCGALLVATGSFAFIHSATPPFSTNAR